MFVNMLVCNAHGVLSACTICFFVGIAEQDTNKLHKQNI